MKHTQTKNNAMTATLTAPRRSNALFEPSPAAIGFHHETAPEAATPAQPAAPASAGHPVQTQEEQAQAEELATDTRAVMAFRQPMPMDLMQTIMDCAAQAYGGGLTANSQEGWMILSRA